MLCMYVRGPNCAWQAIEFTRKLDDGMHPELWSEADQSLATHSDFSHAALVPDLSCCADRGYYSHRPFSCRQNTTSDGAPVDQFRISLVQALSNLRFVLAQRGFKVANYPVIPGEYPPKHLFDPAIQQHVDGATARHPPVFADMQLPSAKAQMCRADNPGSTLACCALGPHAS